MENGKDGETRRTSPRVNNQYDISLCYVDAHEFIGREHRDKHVLERPCPSTTELVCRTVLRQLQIEGIVKHAVPLAVLCGLMLSICLVTLLVTARLSDDVDASDK